MHWALTLRTSLIMNSNYEHLIRLRLKNFREEVGLTAEQVEQRLNMGPGWVTSLETGRCELYFSFVQAVLAIYGKNLHDLSDNIIGHEPRMKRLILAEPVGNNLDIHFEYSSHEAVYQLPNATNDQFEQVIFTLRDGLAQLSSWNVNSEQDKAIKTESVANAFLKAIQLWPNANPSDIWWFIIYRAYCDPHNHPVKNSRLDFSQSWKRTGGWALERILQKHYGPILARYNINLVIADTERKKWLLSSVKTDHRLESDKMDVLLTVGQGLNERLIGVIHVKASFAERRTDDVPMSKALVDAGYISPLWTMDCKSTPSPRPINRGELGPVYIGIGVDPRSAKRKDIEDDRFFSACFSYNTNTLPTPSFYPARAQVHVCTFFDHEDKFTNFIISERERVREMLGI